VPPKPRHPTTLCTPPYDIAQGGMVLHGSRTLFPLGVALLIIGLMLEADATSAMTAIKPTRANRWLRASTATKIDDEAKWHPQLRRHLPADYECGAQSLDCRSPPRRSPVLACRHLWPEVGDVLPLGRIGRQGMGDRRIGLSYP